MNKITLRRYLTKTSPLVDGFPCMTYTISEKEYHRFLDAIGKNNVNECLQKENTVTISCFRYNQNCPQCAQAKTK